MEGFEEGVSEEVAHANLDLIVKAVNLFDDLVGICKDIINASDSPMGTAYELPRVQAFARTILAKVDAVSGV